MTTTTRDEVIRRYTEEPGSGTVTPSVQAALINGHARLSSGPFNWDADLPPVVGGGNSAPSPTAYLLGALAACAVAYVNDTLAPEFGVEVDDLRAEAGCATDLAGLLGVAGADPRLVRLRLAVTIRSASPPDRVEALEAAWVARCPVYLALVEPSAVDVTFSHDQDPSREMERS